ncbi:MAG: SRPBCC family protein [Chitinophagaceae bacterium]
MATTEKKSVTISCTVDLPVQKVWEYWSKPEHIVKWNNASDDWHTPSAENDLRVGGKFVSTMAAKDGSASFNFEGNYTEVEEHRVIAYKMADNREVRITFTDDGDSTEIQEIFDAEDTHPVELQQSGWQSILDNFKEYAEEKG